MKAKSNNVMDIAAKKIAVAYRKKLDKEMIKLLRKSR